MISVQSLYGVRLELHAIACFCWSHHELESLTAFVIRQKSLFDCCGRWVIKVSRKFVEIGKYLENFTVFSNYLRIWNEFYSSQIHIQSNDRMRSTCSKLTINTGTQAFLILRILFVCRHHCENLNVTVYWFESTWTFFMTCLLNLIPSTLLRLARDMRVLL